jgi:Methyltransferase domain
MVARLSKRFRCSLLNIQELMVALLVNPADRPVVVDVGGGHMSPFARHRQPARGNYLICSDILFEQVRNNPEADAGVVADACTGLPFRDGSLDMVVTRSVLEHLPDNAAFVRDTRES